MITPASAVKNCELRLLFTLRDRARIAARTPPPACMMPTMPLMTMQVMTMRAPHGSPSEFQICSMALPKPRMGFQPHTIVPAIQLPTNSEGMTSRVIRQRAMAANGGSSDKAPKFGAGASPSAARATEANAASKRAASAKTERKRRYDIV